MGISPIHATIPAYLGFRDMGRALSHRLGGAMSRKCLPLFLSLIFTLAVLPVAAKDFIPAGTILHCTMDEVNFSPKTAIVGDPVLCHLGPLGSFGHSIFPR